MPFPASIKNIVLVDVNLSMVAGLKSVLDGYPCNVTVTNSLHLARNHIKELQPEILILDSEYPNETSIRLCRKLTQSASDTIVIMTGRNPPREKVLHSIRSGAADFLVKPFTLDFAIRRIIHAAETVYGESPSGEQEDGLVPKERVKRGMIRAQSSLALPHAVSKVLQLSTSTKSNAKDFEDPIRSDPVVTSAVLRLANSAFYGKRGGVSRIRDAIVRVGFLSVRNAVLALSVFKMLPGRDQATSFNRLWFWQHSIATAILARMIADNGRFVDKEDAFLAGLLHDIGKPVLADYAPHDFQTAIVEAQKEGEHLHIIEKKVFELNHAQAGAILLSKWQLPEKITEAILHHHDFEIQPDEDSEGAEVEPKPLPTTPSMSEIIALANQMAKALFLGASGDYFVEEVLGDTLDRLRARVLLDRGGIRESVHQQMKDMFKTLRVAEGTSPAIFQPLVPEGRVVWSVPETPLLKLSLEAAGFLEEGAPVKKDSGSTAEEKKTKENDAPLPQIEIIPGKKAAKTDPGKASGPIESRKMVLAHDMDGKGKVPEGFPVVENPYDTVSLYYDMQDFFVPKDKAPSKKKPVKEKKEKKAKKKSAPKAEKKKKKKKEPKTKKE
ncbi:MAG: response regulator [Planctomycetota bacterium]|nr:response regulator [Planctomycetota bacterium]